MRRRNTRPRSPYPRFGGDAGAATTEMAIITPALLLMITALVQFGLWYHAKNLVNAASQEGARAYRIEGGTFGDARRVADAFLDRTNHGVLNGVEITAGGIPGDADNVGVEVFGRVISVMPIDLNLEVIGSSSGPRERFRGIDE
ncbi:MAG: TadE/TadG family type IV pilus assembly protein [Acidimicrobiales bacterium]